MEIKFFDSLCDGDSVNGIALCLGLTDGDFWTRTAGVQLLYKGQSIDDIDFGRFEDVSNINEKYEISAGQPLSRWFHVVRRVNCCGIEEQTINAAIMVELDSQGNLVEQSCNKIFNVSAKQVEENKILLKWFYQPIHQVKKIYCFKIFCDNGSGIIDYKNPIGNVNYAGRRFYRFVTDALPGSNYRFCIRAFAKDNSNDEFKGQIKIGLNRQSPDGISLLICQTE